jgi:hypothetical protein
MDSSDLRLIIALLFGAFLAITVLSDLIRRRPKAPKMKVKDSGFRRAPTMPVPPDAGFRRSPPPVEPSRPQHSWKVPRR